MAPEPTRVIAGFTAAIVVALCVAAGSVGANAQVLRAAQPSNGTPAPYVHVVEGKVVAASAPRRGTKVKQARRPKAKPGALTASAPAAAAAAAPASRPDMKPQELEIATIPGIPDARFWADDEAAYFEVIGRLGGAWLALSAGGEDSAYGAGLLTGLSEAGKRPEYRVVTGVSSGALLAPFAFLGPKHDHSLREHFEAINAAEVFEDRRTPESLLDTWPLRAFIAKRITRELVAEIAAEHARGRRLIVITTNIDAARPVAWNMGAIAAAGTDASLALFRNILVASSAIPGLFPPVMFESETSGRRIQEMHVDGGLSATVYAAPDSMLVEAAAKPLPMSELTMIINGKLVSEFAVTDRHLIGELGRSLSIGVKRASRTAAMLTAGAARQSRIGFNLAHVDQSFDQPSRGLFDPAYMKVLFETGRKRGLGATPFNLVVSPREASSSEPALEPSAAAK